MQASTSLRRSTFELPGMDCASEERLVRMSIGDVPSVKDLVFDLHAHRLTAIHAGAAEDVLRLLAPLKLGARLAGSEPLEGELPTQDAHDPAAERRVLLWLLGINVTMFVVEIVAGWIGESTGLIADSLDMFADAAVYGVSLYAVGRASSTKLKAARFAGLLQLVLALGLLAEVARRFVAGGEPQSGLMIAISCIALAANVACLVLVAKQRDRGAHMKASYIFSATDVIANAGVIVAGALVWWTRSSWPDLVIGAAIGIVVLVGARRILALR